MDHSTELIRCYGSSWNLRQADRRIWVADQTTGRSTRVIAGTPAELLRKLDCLPKAVAPVLMTGPSPSGLLA